MKKPKGYWNIKENVFEEARKYKTRWEFQKGCIGAYTSAYKNKWLDEIDWFVSPQKPKGYWTREKVFEEAKKYQTIGEFQKGCISAYIVARKNKWIDEMYWFIDGRLKAFTIKKNDSVYKYYWEETNSIYIGRTLISQQKVRESKHNTSEEDTVFRYANANGLAVPPMEIIEENITVKEGLEMEDYWVKYYKEKGYNVLNKAKTGIGSGSTGAIGFGKWNRETVFKKAKEYKTRWGFHKGCPGAYNVAWKNGWLDEMIWFKHRKCTQESRKKMSIANINHPNKSKPIFQINKNTNEIITKFPSASEAQRQLGISFKHISLCCLGKQKTCGGYKWRFAS